MKLATKTAIFLAALLPVSGALAASGEQDALSAVAGQELKRSFDSLKNAESAPLYFLSYEITDTAEYSLAASLGDISDRDCERHRLLDVDARVGSMQMDNTHQLKGGGAGFDFYGGKRYELPLADDAAAIRTQLWLATDAEYKDAQQNYMKAVMNKAVTTAEENPAPDFSPYKPRTYYEDLKMPEFDRGLWEQRLRELSAECRKYPFIHESSVKLTVANVVKTFLSSDGADIRTAQNFVRLGYSVSSRADDGMNLYRGEYYDVADPKDLPAQDKVLEDIGKSIAELKALRDAPLVQPYSGPVILKNRAAAVFFHEIFGHRVEGHRQKLEREGQTFAKMLGKQVSAPLISVYDDPSMPERNGRFLRGFYRFDDEGVPSGRVDLVKDGILKGFLMSRSPLQDFPESNGHGRRSPGRRVVARQGNLVVEASKSVSYDKLRQQLIEECKKQGKPYGLVFDDISGGFTMTGRGMPQSFKVVPLLVYRVYTDGRPDELVRGVDIVGTPLTSFT
ncbi:MAG: TldD/PmbA family protein, partial [Elusimicrobia bacterium]|nr:TldD/PmbA family protein [Elusimicrobiota bacterium]